MTILYIDWNMYGKADIIEAFESLGYDVITTDIPVRHEGDNALIEQKLVEFVATHPFDVAFTSNYYPVVSNICQVCGKKYVSWTYDSPLISLYDKSIANSCNYAFTFDSDECRVLQEKGVNTVFYMPLAVNSRRLSGIKITEQDKKTFASDVSIVASLYNESHNMYDRMEPKLSDYTKGYLNGIMNIQKNLFGAFILEEALYNKAKINGTANDMTVMDDMYQALPYNVSVGSYTNKEYVYANYILARKVASWQRLELIDKVSSEYDIKVYTGGDISSVPKAKHMGTVDYLTDMNKVFRLSKINLNISLPSIHTGIPLRVMDIMGNGGFLLTNYQQDMLDFFEPGVDFVYYSSLDEAVDLIGYYLEHEDERATIASNALDKMKKFHSFEDRLKDMMYIVMNS